ISNDPRLNVTCPDVSARRDARPLEKGGQKPVTPIPAQAVGRLADTPRGHPRRGELRYTGVVDRSDPSMPGRGVASRAFATTHWTVVVSAGHAPSGEAARAM